MRVDLFKSSGRKVSRPSDTSCWEHEYLGKAVQAKEDRSTLPSLDLKGLRNLLFQTNHKDSSIKCPLTSVSKTSHDLFDQQIYSKWTKPNRVMQPTRWLCRLDEWPHAAFPRITPTMKRSRWRTRVKNRVTLNAILCFNATTWWIHLKSGCRLQLGQRKIRFNVAHQVFLAEERENIQIIINMLMLFLCFCEVKCSFNLRWNVSRLRELGIPVPFLHLTNTKKKVFCFSNTADRLSFRLWFLVFFFFGPTMKVNPFVT